MGFIEDNREAWNAETKKGNFWTKAVSSEEIEEARKNGAYLRMLPDANLNTEWVKRVKGRVLVLAGGGGQQGPLLAAQGCSVTVLDISEEMLKRDEETAERNNLDLKTIQHDMQDLSIFEDEYFDAVVNPISINFIPSCQQVYREVARVLRKGGIFITSFANPIMYIFDVKALERGKMKIKYTLPFSSETSLSEKQKEKLRRDKDTFEFSHTLSELIGGLCKSGFIIEDMDSGLSAFEPVDSFVQDCYIALLATKV